MIRKRPKSAVGRVPADVGLLRRTIDLTRLNWWTRVASLLVVTVVVAFLPVPWMVARTPNPPGMAWRLDGRLQFDGETINPPGDWYGLSAGRPPVVAEVVRSWIDPDAEQPRDLRRGSTFNSPAMAEPAAIAIGLAAAGVEVDVTTLVEARHPIAVGLPTRVSVARLNGRAITSRQDWEISLASLGDHNEFVTGDGRMYDFAGTTFPYRTVAMMQAPTELNVSLAGWGRLIPVSWYRNFSLGRSHGLLLALAAYSDASGEDLAAGRAIAGTGVIRGDGTVAPVGGLGAKARAARRAGVDLMIYPADQRCQGETIMASPQVQGMAMIPVDTLTEAIELLRGNLMASITDLSDCDA